MTTSETEQSVFETMLSAEEDKLQGFTRRLFLVEAVRDELNSVTRGKPFWIWNVVVWTMALDTRDAFVIHFASWVRSMYEKGGFLRQVQAHHIRELRKKWRAGQGSPDDGFVQSLLSHHHRESFHRLFPEVKSAFPLPGDVESRRDEFFSEFATIVGDRDSNRAHPYEKQHAKNARMLDLSEQRILVTKAQDFLNDLRLVACKSTLCYSDMNEPPVSIVAEELVDQILLGAKSRRAIVMGRKDRDEFYEELHAQHDRHQGESKPLFNR